MSEIPIDLFGEGLPTHSFSPVWLSPTVLAIATKNHVGIYQLDGDNFVLRGTVELETEE